MSKNKKRKEPKEEEEDKLDKETFKKGVSIVFDRLKKHKRIVFTAIGFSIFGGILGAVVPYLAGRIFDEIVRIASGPVESLYSIFLIIGVWFLVKISSDLISWYVSFHTGKLSTELTIDYRSDGFSRFILLPMSFFSRKSPGEIASKINAAGRRLGNIGADFSVSMLPDFLSIVAAFVITFFIYKPLSLLLLLAILIYLVVLWRQIPELSGLRKNMHDAFVEAHRHGYDALDNVKEVKQAGTEKHEENKLKNLFGEAINFEIKWVSIFTKLNLSQKIIIGLTQLAIFASSVFLVREGLITPGELVAFNGYAAMLFGPFVILGRNWQRIQSGFVELVDAQELLDTETEKYEPDDSVEIEDIEGKVEFRGVTFSYPKEDSEEEDKDNKDRRVLKDISFKVEPGEDVALVGESGVGKSTLIKLLLGFYFPNEGEVLVDGTDIKKLKLSEYRSMIGVVPQEPVLFNDDVDENIKYGKFDASADEVIEAAKRAHAHEFIKKFDKEYKQRVGWKGIKLSSGQKQRIALARSFLKDPSVLILDEPTSALDAESEKFIQDSIKELMEDRTTFIIAHRLSTVREADKIIVLDDGKIAEMGSHETLMNKKNGIYKKLYEMQTNFY